jgi:hypothetical protein
VCAHAHTAAQKTICEKISNMVARKNAEKAEAHLPLSMPSYQQVLTARAMALHPLPPPPLPPRGVVEVATRVRMSRPCRRHSCHLRTYLVEALGVAALSADRGPWGLEVSTGGSHVRMGLRKCRLCGEFKPLKNGRKYVDVGSRLG